jgi:activator of HSP90 ATPase
MTSILQRLRGATTGTTGGLRGTSIVSTKVLPSGQELSASTQTDIVASVSMAFQVTVQNSGNSQVVGVPVTLTIPQSKAANTIVKHARIDFLNPGDKTTVTFHDIGQPDFSVPTTVKIEVQPVPGESNSSNNSAEYPVIFSVA